MSSLAVPLLCPKVSKGVNDYTKDEVLEDDDNHYQEEGEVIDKPKGKQTSSFKNLVLILAILGTLKE